MTRYPVATNGLPLLQWGPEATPRDRTGARRLPRPADPRGGPRSLLAALAEVAAGLLIVVLWVLLWAFFLGAVVAPAGRLVRATIGEHPSLGVAAPPRPALPAEAVSVDRDGGNP